MPYFFILNRKKISDMVEVFTAKCRKDLLWQNMLIGDHSDVDAGRKKRSQTDDGKESVRVLLNSPSAIIY